MKKDIKFSTRMASEDREAIKELAKQSGMSMSDYVTSCCLGKQVVVIDGLKEVLKELKSIGRNLNQLVTLAHMGRVTVVDLESMRHASTREEFITLMESEGYKVRWEDSRRNITYTTPSGWQCRDRLLFGDKYLKENMNYEFRIREEIIHGRAHGAEPSRTHTAADSATSRSPSHERGVDGDDGVYLHTDSPYGETDCVSEEGQRAAGAASHAGADGRTVEGSEAFGADDRTGWETEREAFFSAQNQPAQSVSAAPVSGSAADSRGAVCLMDDVVQLGRALERDQYTEPVMDSTTMRHYADSKTLRKEMELKIARGHKADDHEEEQTYTWQQTM